MNDIKLLNGDISIVKTEKSDEGDLFDLVLESSIPSGNSLIRRCVETPYNYIGRFTLGEEGLGYIDGEFGNGLYSQLSEGFTFSWITEANQEIKRALSKLDESVSVTNIDLSIIPPDTLNIKINYSVDGREDFISLPLKT